MSRFTLSLIVFTLYHFFALIYELLFKIMDRIYLKKRKLRIVTTVMFSLKWLEQRSPVPVPATAYLEDEFKNKTNLSQRWSWG